jgi:hypothetical protein
MKEYVKRYGILQIPHYSCKTLTTENRKHVDIASVLLVCTVGWAGNATGGWSLARWVPVERSVRWAQHHFPDVAVIRFCIDNVSIVSSGHRFTHIWFSYQAVPFDATVSPTKCVKVLQSASSFCVVAKSNELNANIIRRLLSGVKLLYQLPYTVLGIA